jgi:hypothetical protein
VIPEIDIWRAANLMLKRYGEKAPRAPRCGAGSSMPSASSPIRHRLAGSTDHLEFHPQLD